MRIKDEKIEIVRDGKTVKTIHLNRGNPRLCYYFESPGVSAEQAANKPKRKAEIEYNTRAAQEFFSYAVKIVNDIARADKSTAAAIIDGFSETLDKKVKARLFPKNADIGTNSISPISQESAAIITRLEDIDRAMDAFIDKEIETGIHDQEAEDNLYRLKEEAEAPLDALALEDPEEATLIYRNSPLREDEDIEEDEIYLGRSIIVYRTALKELNTPEKRRIFVEAFDRYPTDEEIEAAGGRYNDADRYNTAMREVRAYAASGEPVRLEGFPPEEIKLQ